MSSSGGFGRSIGEMGQEVILRKRHPPTPRNAAEGKRIFELPDRFVRLQR